MDDETPMVMAPSKSKKSKPDSSRMSADDTDTDNVSKGISLSHKSRAVGIEYTPKAENIMAKKDKASEQMKKEFKKQMDLTKNMGQEEEPKAVPAKVVKKAVKPEASAKKVAQKKETPKAAALKAESHKSVVQKKEPTNEAIDEGVIEKQWDTLKTL